MSTRRKKGAPKKKKPATPASSRAPAAGVKAQAAEDSDWSDSDDSDADMPDLVDNSDSSDDDEYLKTPPKAVPAKSGSSSSSSSSSDGGFAEALQRAQKMKELEAAKKKQLPPSTAGTKQAPAPAQAAAAELSDDSDDSGPPRLVGDSDSDSDDDDDDKVPLSRAAAIAAVKKSEEEAKMTKAQKLKAHRAAKAAEREQQRKEDEAEKKRLQEVAAQEKAQKKKEEDERVRDEKRKLLEEQVKAAREAARLLEEKRNQCATRIQSRLRRYVARKHWGELVDERILAARDMRSLFGPAVIELRAWLKAPTEKFSWDREKASVDFVISSKEEDREKAALEADRSTDAADVMLERVDEEQVKRLNAHAAAGNAADMDVDDASVPLSAVTVTGAPVTTLPPPPPGPDIPDQVLPSAESVEVVEVAHKAYKWLENADPKLASFFYRRIEQLANGDRSYALQKRLKGCSYPLYETKLDAGMRILWTMVKRYNDKPSLMIWFVSKHDDVTHYVKRMDLFFRRQSKALNNIGPSEKVIKAIREENIAGGGSSSSSNSVAAEAENDIDAASSVESDALYLTEDAVLLDPGLNCPLKIYLLPKDQISELTTSKPAGSANGRSDAVNRPVKGKLHLRLSLMEREVNAQGGTILLLGRSGTGKTVCVCNRMTSDRANSPQIVACRGPHHQGLSAEEPITQLFVCRSRPLRDHVRAHHHDYCTANETGVERRAHFLTLDQFIGRMDDVLMATEVAKQNGGSQVVSPEALSEIRSRRALKFPPSGLVTYARFRDTIFPAIKRQCQLDPLVVWTQIRSFIKGSFEAVQQSKGYLTLEKYLDLAPARVKLEKKQREEAYEVFKRYQAKLEQDSRGSGGAEGHNWWDEADRVLDLLERSQLNWGANYSMLGGPYDRVYVDEVQDSTQAEIVLFFLASGQNADGLFLAGDPAQSVVEGVDFRFEEVKQIIFGLLGERPMKEKRLVTNFRSHKGILRCATGVIDLMLDLFPDAARRMERDKGLCDGPKPAFFFDIAPGNATWSSEMHAQSKLYPFLMRNKGMRILVHDDYRGAGDDSDRDPASLERVRKGRASIETLVPSPEFCVGIRAAKGMEYPDVIILDFFSYMSPEEQKLWKVRFDSDKSTTEKNMKENDHPQLENALKLLYTAITRCCYRLIFVETRETPATLAFFRWLARDNDRRGQLAQKLEKVSTTTRALSAGEAEVDQEFTATTLESATYMSPDEWMARGVYDAAHANELSMHLYDSAIACFNEAGSYGTRLKSLVQLQKQVDEIKIRITEHLSSNPKAAAPTKETSSASNKRSKASSAALKKRVPVIESPISTELLQEVTGVIKKCISHSMLDHAMDLCKIVQPNIHNEVQGRILQEHLCDRLEPLTNQL